MDRRWHDKYTKLSLKLELFREMNTGLRDKLVKETMNLIEDYNPYLLANDKALNFPLLLDQKYIGKRWYDDDPYLWLMFNTIQMADHVLLDAITEFFEKEIPDNTTNNI